MRDTCESCGLTIINWNQHKKHCKNGRVSCSAPLTGSAGYWKKRCELAEAFIHSHVADPDITDEMCKTHGNWVEFRNMEPNVGDETR
jgi:hypothetical protein